MNFLVLSGKMVLLFPENMTLFFRWKIKDNLSQKIHRNIIFSVYSVKMVLLFPTDIILSFCQKSKNNLLQKKMTWWQKQDDIFGVTKKYDIHPRKYGISSDREIKDDKKVNFYNKIPITLCTLMETVIGVFIYCFPMKKKQKRKT